MVVALGSQFLSQSKATSVIILATYSEEFPDGNSQRKIIQTDYVEGAKGYENFNKLYEIYSFRGRSLSIKRGLF
jgi:hypothetical protein